MKKAFPRVRLIHLLLAATATLLSGLLPNREAWAQG
jgi:hypothetical protein